MVDRRPIYNRRNTITGLKKLTRDEIDDHLKNKAGKLVKFKFKSKVVLTLECRFCGQRFQDYRVGCFVCHCCQYCGLYALEYSCPCGNIAPDDIIVIRKNKRIKIV